MSGTAFAKHGTSFETRISVFDKCRGGEPGGITADLTRPISLDVASLLSLSGQDLGAAEVAAPVLLLYGARDKLIRPEARQQQADRAAGRLERAAGQHHSPGRVRSVRRGDRDAARAHAAALHDPEQQPDGTVAGTVLPVVPGVPVRWPWGGGRALTWGLSAGDRAVAVARAAARTWPRATGCGRDRRAR